MSGVYDVGNLSIQITPDGRTYAYSHRHTLSTLYVAEGLRLAEGQSSPSCRYNTVASSTYACAFFVSRFGVCAGLCTPSLWPGGCKHKPYISLISRNGCFTYCCQIAALSASAFATLSHLRETLFAVTGAALLLLFISIHNAWDPVTYDIWVNHCWRQATLAKIH